MRRGSRESTRAVTSSYVNPVVAVLLGHVIAGEPLTYRMTLAMVTIVLGVIVITSSQISVKAPVELDEREPIDEAV